MDKKKKIIAGAAAGAVAVLVIVLFAVFGGASKEELEVREAFKAFSAAIATGNKDAISGMVSPKFNDAGLDYNAAVDEFSIKRPTYNATLDSAHVVEGTATLAYLRREVVDKKPLQLKIVNETWVKEEDGNWKLVKFSPVDREQIPKLRQARQEAEEKLKAEREAAEAEEAARRNVAYSAAGKRDPFESLILEGVSEEGAAAESGAKCDPDRDRDYLEGFDLFSFKVVGIVFSNGYYALVEAQNGNGYTIRPGMYMGRRCGKVTKITADKIVVAEKYTTPRGGFNIREVELKLKEEVE